MGSERSPVDISAELSSLKHERKNQKMKSLPPDMTIQRRPLHHPPVASMYAGAHVQKVVYVSSHTPVMSAVKRVKKLLSQIEKRAIQSVDAKGSGAAKAIAEMAKINEQLAKTNEEVLVKASGKAMSQALRVGEWFRTREKEMLCEVKIRTGSAPVVDDIVELQGANKDGTEAENDDQIPEENTGGSTTLEGGDTTMELLGNDVKPVVEIDAPQEVGIVNLAEPEIKVESDERKKRKRVRRRRPVYDKDDIPEARIRWVKTIEVAISLKT